MDQATHNKIVSFIWGIADDVLRDLFRRGKYLDVILLMCVLRRLDAVLEPTMGAVLDTRTPPPRPSPVEGGNRMWDASRLFLSPPGRGSR